MSSGFKRIDRISEMMQRELALIVQKEVKHPELKGLITISSVKVSKDLGYAKVYFTVLNQDPDLTCLILNESASQIRMLLAHAILVRSIPQLKFVYDDSLEYASHLTQLINKANPATPTADTDDDTDA